MGRYVVRRIIQGIVTLWVLTVIAFVIVHTSGDPPSFYMAIDASPEMYERTRTHLGLDKPLPVQYIMYVGNILRGDFGASIYFRGQDTLDLVLHRFPATLQLSGVAAAIMVIIALPIGILSALKRNTPIDFLGKIIAIVGQSFPQFWLGIMLMWIFGVQLGLLPVAQRGGLDHIILPAITLGWFGVAGLMRLVRSSMLDVLDSDYVRLARVKGLSERTVVLKHVLKNAAIPPLTFFAVLAGAFMTGSVVVESVFAWNGVGLLAIEAMRGRDYLVMQGLIFLYGGMYIVLMLLTDILYAYLNPKIRYGTA